MSVGKRFKGYFLHGLAVLLPSILTIWLFVWGYKFIQENISIHINRGLVHIIAIVAHENTDVGDLDITEKEVQDYLLETRPELEDNEVELRMRTGLEENIKQASIRKMEDNLAKTWVEGPGAITGFIIALIGVCIIGALLASYVGKRLWRMAENFIMNTPLLKRVYPYVKQITDFVLTQEDQKQIFSRVVAVEYPKEDIWSIGFVTGSGLEKVVNTVKKEFYTVIIPTSPTPFTGFVITVPKENTIELNITMEEALRFVISGGVITPGSEQAKALLTDSQKLIDVNQNKKKEAGT